MVISTLSWQRRGKITEATYKDIQDQNVIGQTGLNAIMPSALESMIRYNYYYRFTSVVTSGHTSACPAKAKRIINYIQHLYHSISI